MENLLTVVLSRQRSPTPEGQAIEKVILQGLDRWPELPVLVIPHLYDLLPNGMGFQALREIRTNIVLLSWLYPRAAFWVLQANGVQGQMGQTPLVPEEELEPAARPTEQTKAADSPNGPNAAAGPTAGPTGSHANRTIWCLDLRNPGVVEDYLAELERLVELTHATAVSVPEESGPPSRLGPFTMQEIEELLQPRWYPVIDRSRCRNCQECLNFCLFGVYGLDGQGRVYVEMPDMCRPGCPACARVCPSGAIMFPHYSDPAIAGGPGQARPSAQVVDFSALPGTGVPAVFGGVSMSGHPVPPGAGSQTSASGQGADASGQGTNASGQGTDASAQGSDASGQGSDVSGQGTDASGQGTDASAEGAETPPSADQPQQTLDRLVDQLDQMEP